MRADYAGDKPDNAEQDESEQNILDGELCDTVADGRGLPDACKINADGEEDAKHGTKQSERESALWKHLAMWCLLTHGRSAKLDEHGFSWLQK